MDKRKPGKLQKRGWKVGTVSEFLNLTPEEAAIVEVRLALSQGVRELRQRCRVSQVELAEMMGSSQSRVAKVESGDPRGTVDLMVKSLTVLGASREDLGKMIASWPGWEIQHRTVLEKNIVRPAIGSNRTCKLISIWI
jgi:DNA-binding transcriptional regulator YiaG